jgi:hypothetical protein
MTRRFASEITGKLPGRMWFSRWLKANGKQLDSRYLIPADLSRKKADNWWQYELYFKRLEGLMTKYEIQEKDIYNLDEKGFLISILNKTRRVFTRVQKEKGKLLGSGQDGNREWITILGCICADRSYLSPGLIYQATTGNIQDTWLQDFDPKSYKAFFASSLIGWTNDKLGFKWLTTVFDCEIKQKARFGRDWQLLFVDGHGSHINMRFLEWAIDHKILVAAFPPHSTY